jgi:glycosyltransferase
MAPSFSIIIPTYNRRDMLADALASIRAQQWPRVQTIVVDGGSTDGTLDDCAKLNWLTLLKGPDQGVYDALNKGISVASEEIVGFLNSDDVYEGGAFAAVSQAVGANPGAQAVCGTAILEESGHVLAAFDRSRDKRLVSPRTALIGSSILNARFYRTDALKTTGYFNLQFRYVADRDWLLRWHEAQFTTIAIPDIVYRYRRHPQSLTFSATRQEKAIRNELVQLARLWRSDPSASAGTRRCAQLLEGRCLIYFALLQWREHGIRAAAKELLISEGRPSSVKLRTALRSAADVILQRLFTFVQRHT